MKFYAFAVIAFSTLVVAVPPANDKSAQKINDEAKKKSTSTAGAEIAGAAGGLPIIDAATQWDNGKKFSEGGKDLNDARFQRMREGTEQKSKVKNPLPKFEDGTGRRKARRAIWVRV